MSQMRKITYRAGLLEPRNLTTIEKIDNALNEFGAVLTEANHVQALKGLLEKPHIVELLLSSIDEEIPLQKWILDGFPTDPKLSQSSFSCELLFKLSLYFLFHPSSDEGFGTMSECHQTIKNALLVIRAPFASIFLDEVRQHPKDDRPAPSKKFKAKGNLSQKEEKLRKKIAAPGNNLLNELPFVALNIPVPRSLSEAEGVVSGLVSRLKAILEFYLKNLRYAEVSLKIKEGFIPQERPDDMTVVTEVCLPTEDPIPAAPTTAALPSAFSMVYDQPWKSAWNFDSPEGFGEWRILVSSQAGRDLRGLRKKASASYDIVIKKIKELSNGHFSADNQKRLKGPSKEVPIFEAKPTRDLRVVYQVDCVASEDNRGKEQVLRIFGIFTHTQMDKRLWDLVAGSINQRGAEYRRRCLERIRVNDGGDVYRPARSSSLGPEFEARCDTTGDIPDLPGDDSNQLHKILTLEKYITLSKEFLDCIEADHDAAFPFEVSAHEREVIQHPSSCYVLGRSGTGKTTTMLFKMLWIERAYQMSIDHTERPRQVFVTKSSKLAQKVEEHFNKYLASLAFSSDVRGEFKVPKPRMGQRDGDDENLWNEDDGAEWRNDLPKKFSELEECHFPLFLTFDQLCSMLEADIKQVEVDSRNASSDAQPTYAVLQTNKHPSRMGNLVTYDRFLGDYWPHFNQSLKKIFHPSLVYSEIMGIISGSEGSIYSADGYLNREAYESLSSRSQPTFGDHRSNLYEIFLSYRKIKNNLGDFDAADRTHSILHAIMTRPLMGQRVDYLYVDETQDNLLIDTLLLRMLCRNPDGLFWAGDTAQTISAGSSFRFKDLKAFLHRIEKRRQLSHPDVSVKKKSTPPKDFHLAVNYRSHAGIVNCAHTVVKLISTFWPYSIDALSPERGNANGAKPIFFTDVGKRFVAEALFLSPEDSTDNVELGAHQCILVRDDDAKERLVAQIGKVGIILTIYDSKGLEFNDVFLYNFFHDSAVDASQWRVVLNGIPSESSRPAPQFDAIRHAAICSELKSLYVAITRARNILWIADESLKGESMRTLWANSNQIRSCKPGEELSNFASPSRPEEWAARAKEFFSNHQYALARDGYERANKPHAAAVADAYHRREVARRTPLGSGKSKGEARNAAFKLAAEAFYSSACSTANSKAKKDYFGVSAECYEDAGEFLRAAQVYQSLKNFTKAVVLFRKAGKFGDAHELIVNFADEIEPNSLAVVRDVVRLYHVTQKDFEKAHQLFNTVDEEIEYLEDRNLDLAHVDLLLIHGRSMEAAQLHLGEGRILQALDIFLGDKENRETSMQSANDCIIQGLWDLLPFGVSMSEVNSEEVDVLLSRSELLDQNLLSKHNRDELAMFKIIRSGEFEKLSELASSFVQTNNLNSALLCFDLYFIRTPSLLEMDITEMEECLKQFFDYIYILHQVAFIVDPSTNPQIWKLLGVKSNKLEENFLIPPGTVLYRHAIRSNAISVEDANIPLKLSKDQFTKLFHDAVRERLLDQVTRENDVCRKAPALSVCLRQTAYGDCSATSCPRSHIHPDHEWFQHWLKVHLLQILVYHSIWRIQFRSEMQSQQRFWILKLHEVLNPVHFSIGSSANIDFNNSMVQKAFGIAIEWVRAISDSLDSWAFNYNFLTVAIGVADLAFAFNRKEASTYLYRSDFALSECPAVYLRGEYQQNSILELLISLNNKGSSSLLMGILFIRHVMEAKIPVDINVFLTFVERICGLLIICNRYRWNQSFHNITLPSSWWTLILTHFDPVEATQQDSTSRFWLLLDPLSTLLEGLYFSYYSVGHLLCGPEISVRSQDSTVRSTFIARVCRVLGLLGYNITVPTFRVKIHELITSLRRRQFNHGFSKLYASYVYADSFDEIAKATRRSMQGSPLDEMVELLHEPRTQFPVPDIFGMRRVVYKSQDEILTLLRRSCLASIISDSDSADHHPNTNSSEYDVDSAVPIPIATEVEGATVNGIDEHIPSLLEENPGESVDEDPNFIPQTEIPEDIYVEHSEKEIVAASIIQRKYRTAMARRHRLGKQGLEGGVHRCFKEYLGAFQPSMNQGSPRYKVWYLGPLPHILASLDALQVLVSRKKAEFRSLLLNQNINHQLLDEVGPALTHINSLAKAIKQHRQMLGPKADMHHLCDVQLIQKTIRDTLTSLSNFRLPIDLLTEEIRQELDHVEKIIQVAESPSEPPRDHLVAKKKKRPALNIEDPTNPLDFGDWEDDQDLETTEISEDVYVGHSEREIAAASVIQRRYRTAMARRHLSDKPGLEGGIQRYFRECLEAFPPSIGGGFFGYKRWYLGPLPHVLASLDAIQVLTATQKGKLKRMLRNENTNYQLLDEVVPALTYITSVAKAIQQHRQMLGPKADMHHLHDVQLLQKTIRDTLSSLSDLHLPIDLLTEEIRKELDHVEKIIQVAESSSDSPRDYLVAKKEKRPALNVEDPINPLDLGDWEDDQELLET